MWFHEVTEFFERIERSSGQLARWHSVRRSVRRHPEIAIIAYLCEGGLLPPWAGLETGIGEQMARLSVAHVRQRYRKAGDLGTVAEQILPATSDTTLTVAGVYK